MVGLYILNRLKYAVSCSDKVNCLSVCWGALVLAWRMNCWDRGLCTCCSSVHHAAGARNGDSSHTDFVLQITWRPQPSSVLRCWTNGCLAMLTVMDSSLGCDTGWRQRKLVWWCKSSRNIVLDPRMKGPGKTWQCFKWNQLCRAGGHRFWDGGSAQEADSDHQGYKGNGVVATTHQ